MIMSAGIPSTDVGIPFTDVGIPSTDVVLRGGACNAEDTKMWEAGGKNSAERDYTDCLIQAYNTLSHTNYHPGSGVTSCIKQKRHYSDSCAKCFGDAADQSVPVCAPKCGRSPTPTQCFNQCTKGFIPQAETCTGWKWPSNEEGSLRAPSLYKATYK